MTGLGFAGFAVLVLILHGEIAISAEGNRIGSVAVLVGWSELLIATICLWFTAKIWTRGIAAIAFIGAAKATVFGLLGGSIPSLPFRSIPWAEPVCVVAYLILCGLLTIRFSSHQPTKLERAALILALLMTIAQIAVGTWLAGMLISMSSLLLMRALKPNGDSRLAQ